MKNISEMNTEELHHLICEEIDSVRGELSDEEYEYWMCELDAVAGDIDGLRAIKAQFH
jgi:hypothetical protein